MKKYFLLYTLIYSLAFFAYSRESSKMSLEKTQTISVGETISFEKIKVKLDNIDWPATNVPGNRPFYHLILTSAKNESIAIRFDPMNSGEKHTVDSTFLQIKTFNGDSKRLQIDFSK